MIAAAIFVSSGGFAPAEPSPRPNILFIRADDLARWAVGFNGNAEVRTPNIDRIRREGASFANAFVTTPVCSPSRVASMSGLHSFQARVPDWIQPGDLETGVEPEYLLWPEILRDWGYRTAFVGKWHMGLAEKHHPTRNGFDRYVGALRGGAPVFEPELEVDGETRKMEGKWRTDVFADYAIECLNDLAAGKNYESGYWRPFLLCLDFCSPHAPYAPVPPEDAAPFADLDPAIPPEHGSTPERVKRLTREYYGAVAQLDRNVGRVLDRLDALGLAENTVVVFTSDHGYCIGHHGLWHKGNATSLAAEDAGLKDPERRRPNMFDASLRVPLAVRWPGRIAPGTVVEAPVLQIDFHPSIPSLAGIEMPELPASQRAQGRDFAPFLLAERASAGAAPRDAIFGDYDMMQGKRASMRSIRTAGAKLVLHAEEEGGRDEYYDLAADPGETTNRIDDPAARPAVEELRARLLAWMKEYEDPMLPEFEKDSR